VLAGQAPLPAILTVIGTSVILPVVLVERGGVATGRWVTLMLSSP
jgi:hypothetical protein